MLPVIESKKLVVLYVGVVCANVSNYRFEECKLLCKGGFDGGIVVGGGVVSSSRFGSCSGVVVVDVIAVVASVGFGIKQDEKF